MDPVVCSSCGAVVDVVGGGPVVEGSLADRVGDVLDRHVRWEPNPRSWDARRAVVEDLVAVFVEVLGESLAAVGEGDVVDEGSDRWVRVNRVLERWVGRLGGWQDARRATDEVMGVLGLGDGPAPVGGGGAGEGDDVVEAIQAALAKGEPGRGSFVAVMRATLEDALTLLDRGASPDPTDAGPGDGRALDAAEQLRACLPANPVQGVAVEVPSHVLARLLDEHDRLRWEAAARDRYREHSVTLNAVGPPPGGGRLGPVEPPRRPCPMADCWNPDCPTHGGVSRPGYWRRLLGLRGGR